MEMLEKKIYFIGGKGGVGKSTTSAAMALLLAQKDKKILLVSTDPAHNTGDLFHKNFSGGKIERATPNLDVLEIDSEQESRNYINGVKGNLKGLVKATMLEEVNRQIDMAASSPGTEEAALFDKITSLILEEITNYDAIVFDTAHGTYNQASHTSGIDGCLDGRAIGTAKKSQRELCAVDE